MRFFRLFVLPLVTTLGCDDPAGPDRDIKVTVSTDLLIVRRSAPTTITVTAINRGSQSITINGNDCPARFEILDVRGEIVGPFQSGLCDASARSVTLGPQEALTFQYSWNGTGMANAASTLAPGAYRIRGHAPGLRRRLTSDAIPIAVASSAP